MTSERRAEIKAKMANYYNVAPVLAKGEEAARAAAWKREQARQLERIENARQEAK